jgi:predicted GIY-YIG superfamily endonuclease
MKPFGIYILQCGDGSYYTGHTDNLENRLVQHDLGITGNYTATRKPLKLVFHHECGSRLEAITLEKQIKGWSRAKKRALIAGDFETIVVLANTKGPWTSSGRTVRTIAFRSENT